VRWICLSLFASAPQFVVVSQHATQILSMSTFVNDSDELYVVCYVKDSNSHSRVAILRTRPGREPNDVKCNRMLRDIATPTMSRELAADPSLRGSTWARGPSPTSRLRVHSFSRSDRHTTLVPPRASRVARVAGRRDTMQTPIPQLDKFFVPRKAAAPFHSLAASTARCWLRLARERVVTPFPFIPSFCFPV